MADGLELSEVTIRRAVLSDVDEISAMFDKTIRADWFERKGSLRNKIKKEITFVAVDRGKIIAVSHMSNAGALIHMLVLPQYRGTGVGSKLLGVANPPIVRSKSDQTTGDPKAFYLKNGYRAVGVPKVGRKRNIELLERIDG